MGENDTGNVPEIRRPEATAAQPPPPWWPAPRPRTSPFKWILRSVAAVIFLLSVLLNISLLVFVAAQVEMPLATVILREGSDNEVVAVYGISGVLDAPAAAGFDAFVRQVKDDGNVKAVVLRVESPGGTVSASDQMHSMVTSLQKRGKKVVVSMGGLAASGAYYLSAPADEIYAEPTTITGSIGVLMEWPVVKGTLDKIGVDMMVLKSRHAEDWKDSVSLFKKPDPQQLQRLQEMLDEAQQRFESIVSEGRAGKLTPYQAPAGEDKPAASPAPEYEGFNGKVYSAEKAKTIGLVDAVGYQGQAVDAAARLAALGNPKVIQYEKRKSFTERLMGAEQSQSLRLDVRLLDELRTPRILLLWKVD